LAGGAGWIDVKEPDRGPMGAADPTVWSEVRKVVPTRIPLSVALGEIGDWMRDTSPIGFPSPEELEGVDYRKLGMAGLTPGSAKHEPTLVRKTQCLEQVLGWTRQFGGSTGWILVAYSDSGAADAPDPSIVMQWVIERPEFVGVLVDTWDKTRPPTHAPSEILLPFSEALRESGKLIGLAGGLDVDGIRGIGEISPDVWGVRGSACEGGRSGSVVFERVLALANALQDRGDRSVL
jgi:(5-formylfuran-3-yl)methyl phosphate synthase